MMEATGSPAGRTWHGLYGLLVLSCLIAAFGTSTGEIPP
jgi:hypothetical protein